MESMEQPLHSMLQCLNLTPPSLHLPTIVRQMLPEDINLDVLHPRITARALRKPYLADKFLAPPKEFVAETVVELLAVEGL